MKFSLLSYIGLFASQITCSSPAANSEKPLHIGVSITVATRSHIKYLLEILEESSKRGHRITFLCMDEMRRFGKGYNLTYHSLGDVKIYHDEAEEIQPYTGGGSMFSTLANLREDLATVYRVSFPVFEQFYREEKPDLMVCDFAASSCVESAAKNSMPMVIGYQSLMFSYQSPFLTGTGALEPTTIENHTFMQRMKHAFVDPISLVLGSLPVLDLIEHERRVQGIPKSYQFPILGHMGIGIANSYVGLENARNIPSHVYPIGPILTGDTPALPEELQSFMDIHGKVLYVAFGTMVKLSQDVILKLLIHFQRAINENVLDGVVWGLPRNDIDLLPKTFKSGNVEYSTAQIVEGTHDKIKILKWAPQQSILNHPSTKLFLSHGGLDSIYESMNANIPMLILPFLGDQPRNAMLIAETGAADYIYWNNMSDEEIYQKFVKLLDPNNLELKSKVKQMQLITKFSSKRKSFAADLIETYAYSAKACRQFDTPKPFESPCEVLPFLPLDKRMSSIKANLVDVYITGFLIAGVIVFSIIYISYYSAKRLVKFFYYKQKQE
jgi:UDP:flavonoid glycosyltransferase YjiC (YdhE family)